MEKKSLLVVVVVFQVKNVCLPSRNKQLDNIVNDKKMHKVNVQMMSWNHVAGRLYWQNKPILHDAKSFISLSFYEGT